VQKRRYFLQHCAIEVFFSNRKSTFIAFKDTRGMNIAFNAIVSQMHPPNLNFVQSAVPKDILRKSGMTEAWLNRKISNFDYLMFLNTVSGRTYNDLRQYPVFPWVIADYKSRALDLNDPKTFRDLSKPMGVQDPSRIPSVKEHYQQAKEVFPDSGMPPYHYGYHYSNPDIVFYYLIRLEPFTTYFANMQSFDFGDRMFTSMDLAYQTSIDGKSFKELIPEFFYLPEFLMNTNKFNFGHLQSGSLIDDVILPPWANESAEKFIRLNREALESEYVSDHLNDWIDLIFGYKQRGEEAEEALNMFPSCSYEGTVDWSKIEDQMEREAIKLKISYFGQTPLKLFGKPHPKRRPIVSPIPPPLFSGTNIVCCEITSRSLTIKPDEEESSIGSFIPLVYVSTPILRNGDSGSTCRIVTVNKYHVITSRKLTQVVSPTDVIVPQEKSDSGQSSIQPVTIEATAEPSVMFNPVEMRFSRDIFFTPKVFSLSIGGSYMFCGGFWDNSFKVVEVSENRIVESISFHSSPVTCLARSSSGAFLVTGSRDTTLAVWNVTYKSVPIERTPRCVLFGHNDEVISVAVCSELNVVVSGSRDGSILLHNLHTGKFVWSYTQPETEISSISISPDTGRIAVAGINKSCLLLFDINGRLLHQTLNQERINDICISPDSEYFVAAGTNTLSFRSTIDFSTLKIVPVPSPVMSLCVALDNSVIICALSNGSIFTVTQSFFQDAFALHASKQSMRKKQSTIGF